MEQALRIHRNEALKLLEENRAQAREAVEVLVKERLSQLTATASGNRALTNEQLQAFYADLLEHSYTMFTLGFTLARTTAEPAGRR